jgi:hypothetical protein
VECALEPATATKAAMESRPSFNVLTSTAQNTLAAMNHKRSAFGSTTNLTVVRSKLFAVSITIEIQIMISPQHFLVF